MPLPNRDQPIELNQLTAVSSVVDVVARYVDDLLKKLDPGSAVMVCLPHVLDD